MSYYRPTDAAVHNLPPDGALEEAGAAITAEHSIVLPIGLVTAHQAGGGGSKATACQVVKIE